MKDRLSFDCDSQPLHKLVTIVSQETPIILSLSDHGFYLCWRWGVLPWQKFLCISALICDKEEDTSCHIRRKVRQEQYQ